MAINNTALTTVASSIYTSSGNTAVVTIHLCNYSAGNLVANVYAIPNGGTPGATNIIYSNVTITAYNTLVIDTEKFFLSNGESIRANVSANSSVTATVTSVRL
jgi:hypothetical protein